MAARKIVYLDTSDFQNLTDGADKHKYAELKKLLSTKVRSGEIEIRYSCFHMYEMTQRAPQNVSYFIPRMETLSALTRGKCFRNALELYYLQVARIASMKDVSGINPYMEKNGWMQETFLSKEVPGMREILSVNPAVAKKMAKAQGISGVRNIIELMLESFKKNNPGYEQAQLEDYEDGLRWHSDGLPENKISVHPVRWVKHIQRLQEATDGFNPQVTIAKLTTDFAAQIDVARTSIRDDLSKDVRNWEVNRDIAMEEIDALPWSPRFNPILANKMGLDLDESQWRHLTVNPVEGTVLGNLKALYRGYLRLHHLEGRGSPKRIQNGDLIDLMHMTYIPFVHVFRSDGPNSDVALEFARSESAQVLKTDDELFNL